MSGKVSSHSGSRPGSRFDADSTLIFPDRPARRACRKAAALAGLAVDAAYPLYRPLAFSYYRSWEVRQRTVPPAPPGFPVDVFTYDEDVDLLRRTVRGTATLHLETDCVQLRHILSAELAG